MVRVTLASSRSREARPGLSLGVRSPRQAPRRSAERRAGRVKARFRPPSGAGQWMVRLSALRSLRFFGGGAAAAKLGRRCAARTNLYSPLPAARGEHRHPLDAVLSTRTPMAGIGYAKRG